MPDQATDLRELVRHCAAIPPAASAASAGPRKVVVFGGKGGVGTTTVAVNLAAALSARGARALLVDAAGGDAAILCRLEPQATLADVVAGARTVTDALQSGPAGIRVLPGAREPAWTSADGPAAATRLMAQMATLGDRADAVIVDAGSRADAAARRFWQAADLLLLVTTPDTAAIMDTYSAVKLLAEPGSPRSIHLLVNTAARPDEAEEVFGRLAQVCRRFLAIRLLSAGWVPEDPRIRDGATGEPLVVASPACSASRQLRLLAQRAAENTT